MPRRCDGGAAGAVVLAAVLALAACRGAEPGGTPSDTLPDAAPGSAGQTAAPDTGLGVVARRTGERAYALTGVTDEPVLQLTVEDGHNVLYGPAAVEVRGGRFETDVTLEPTAAAVVYAYITDPLGLRQWVFSIPLGQAEVRWGARVD